MNESNKKQTLVVVETKGTSSTAADNNDNDEDDDDDASKETISENDGRHNSTVDVMLQTLISLMMIRLTMKMMIIITSNDS